MSLPLICALVFTGLLATALALVLMVPRARKQSAARRARLAELSRYRLLSAVNADAAVADGATESTGQRGRVLRERSASLAAPVLQARGNRAELAVRLERAGLRLRPEDWVAIQAAAIVGGTVVAVVVSGLVLLAPVGAFAGWFAARSVLAWKIRRRCAAFEAALPEALQLLAGALRSGFAINQSVGAVVREGVEPVAGEFARALHEVRLGAELNDALDSVAERTESRDLEIVVMAMRTAREVGGNLAEILQTTVATMRERVELRGEVKVLSAEGRLSAKILIGLPVLMAVYMFVFKRDYLAPMYSTGLGIAMSSVAVVLLVVGAFWLSRLTRIEV